MLVTDNNTILLGITIALVAATPPMVIALAGLVQGRSNGRKADRAVVRADELATTANEIRTQTNGHLTVVTAALNVATARIAALEAKIDGMLIANSHRSGMDGQTPAAPAEPATKPKPPVRSGSGVE